MYDYDDFYSEPSEFEQQVDVFKEALMKSVKADYVAKMDRLEKENAELQEVKGRMKQIEWDRDREKVELENSKKTALQEAKKMRLSELLKDYKCVIYKVCEEYTRGPKCDQCDKERTVTYTTPLGRTAKEKCACADYTIIRKVGEVAAASLEHYSADYGVNVIYYDEHREETVKTYQMYEPGVDFAKINSWTYFSNKEDCQKYYDWLNAKEKVAP